MPHSVAVSTNQQFEGISVRIAEWKLVWALLKSPFQSQIRMHFILVWRCTYFNAKIPILTLPLTTQGCNSQLGSQEWLINLDSFPRVQEMCRGEEGMGKGEREGGREGGEEWSCRGLMEEMLLQKLSRDKIKYLVVRSSRRGKYGVTDKWIGENECRKVIQPRDPTLLFFRATLGLH